MTRIQVNSSNVKSVGYDPDAKVLEVEFQNPRGGEVNIEGPVYQYVNVPEERYCGLVSAESPGAYFAAQIKSKFKFEKIEKENA